MKLRAVTAVMALALASITALGGCSGKEELSMDLVDGREGVVAIAVLPAAWSDGKTSNSCELCPDALVLKPVAGGDAELVTAFFYEALARHPAYRTLSRNSVSSRKGESKQQLVERLVAQGEIDFFLVPALAETVQRVGTARTATVSGEATVYAALLGADGLERRWSGTEYGGQEMPGMYGRISMMATGEELRLNSAMEQADLHVRELVARMVKAAGR